MINFCPTSIYHKNSVSQFCSENFMFPFTVLKIKDMLPWRKSQAKQRLSIHWFYISRKKKYMVKMVASYLLEKTSNIDSIRHTFSHFPEVWVISRLFHLLSTIYAFWLPACQQRDFFFLTLHWSLTILTFPASSFYLVIYVQENWTLLPYFTNRFCHLLHCFLTYSNTLLDPFSILYVLVINIGIHNLSESSAFI